MLKIKFDFSVCVVIEILLVFCIVVGTIIQSSSLITMCFYLSFIGLLVYLFMRTLSEKFDFLTLMLIILTVACVMINGFFSSAARIGFNYFKKMFMFIAFCLTLCFTSEDRVSSKCILFISRVPVFAALILVASYYSGMNRVMLGNALTLGFSNPNFTGMWLLHFFVYSFLKMIDKREGKFLRLISIALLPILVHLITLTNARSCLIGVVFLCVFSPFFCMGKSEKFRRFITGAALLFPLVFALIYQYLLSSNWFLELFDFMVSAGKGLDSRLVVWVPALEAIQRSPLTGDYSGISHGTGMSQMHNTHLDVIASYGIIVGVLFLALLMSKVFRLISGPKNNYQYCAVCGFLAITITGTFEAAVVSGAMGMNILTALLLALANHVPESNLNWTKVRLKY